jgi:hypothetical protein
VCECGVVVSKTHKSRHKQSQQHYETMRDKGEAEPLVRLPEAEPLVESYPPAFLPRPADEALPHPDLPDIVAEEALPEVVVEDTRETFCTADYKYNDAEQQHPDTFPFKTHTDFLFYAYLCSGAAPTLAQIDLLLILLRDPLFKPETDLSVTKAESFLAAIDKKIPLAPLFAQECERKVRVEKKLPKVIRKKTVHFVKPSEVVQTFMATPGLRKHLTLGHDDVGAGPVYAFNQSPFHKEPFKWMYNQSFQHCGVEYSIGDSVCLVDENATQMLIQKLEYRPRENTENTRFEEYVEGAWLPVLYILGCGIVSMSWAIDCTLHPNM